ncbi:MAG: hypothetical protein JWR68_159 [Polaromonas sp.]|nr:hypothetical protein [Polaromonas sp.]
MQNEYECIEIFWYVIGVNPNKTFVDTKNDYEYIN